MLFDMWIYSGSNFIIKRKTVVFYFEHLFIIFADRNNIYNVTTSKKYPQS